MLWLTKAADEGYPSYPRFSTDQSLTPLKGYPPYEALLQRYGSIGNGGRRACSLCRMGERGGLNLRSGDCLRCLAPEAKAGECALTRSHTGAPTAPRGGSRGPSDRRLVGHLRWRRRGSTGSRRTAPPTPASRAQVLTIEAGYPCITSCDRSPRVGRGARRPRRRTFCTSRRGPVSSD